MITAGKLLEAASVNAASGGNFVLPELPYSDSSLEPIISAQTINYHWGKHIEAYINNLNRLKKDTQFESATLQDVCMHADGGIYNNGAQVWNHIFYFETFSNEAKDAPSGKLLEAINRDFESLDKLKAELESKGLGQFGSGWVWLAKDTQGKLSVVAMPNAENPIKDGLVPLLGLDVWEHAYYLDYQNRRGDHLKDLWKIIDWSIVEQRY